MFVQNLDPAHAWSMQDHATVDVVELCGGAGAITQLSIRRRLKGGRNCDLTTNVDLTHATHRQQARTYFRVKKPFVFVAGPPGTAFGPWSHLNEARLSVLAAQLGDWSGDCKLCC